MYSDAWWMGSQGDVAPTGSGRRALVARHHASAGEASAGPNAFPASRRRSRASPAPFRLAVQLCLLLFLATPRWARAQDPSLPVEPGARGTVSGLFLGAEVVMLLEAAAGVRPLWAYAVGGGAGAIGGSIIGFASDEAGNTSLSMGMLVGAVVLAVPTTIAVLSATAYRAPVLGNANLSSSPTGSERLVGWHGPTPDTTRHASVIHVSRRPTSFLVEYHQQSLAIGVPAVKVSQVYSRRERATSHLPDAIRVVVPLFRMSF